MLVLNSLTCLRAVLVEDGGSAMRSKKAGMREMRDDESGDGQSGVRVLSGTAWKRVLAIDRWS